MATSFLIGYPDIPFQALKIAPSATFAGLHNLFRGPKYSIAALAASASGTKTLDFNLGSGFTASAQYLYIARADLLISPGLVTTLKLQRSTDGSSWTNEVNQTSFGSVTLGGPDSSDWITTFTQSSAYRYWRAEYTVSGSSKIPHSKLFFGSFLDMGVEPEEWSLIRVPAIQSRFVADSGAEHFERNGRAVYKLKISWAGVSNTAAKNFMLRVGNRRHIDTFVLYTATQNEVLDGLKTLYCKCTAAQRVQMDGSPDWNLISAEFEEAP